MKKPLKQTKNGNITYLNLLEATKSVLRQKFMAINTYIKKKE